MPTKRESPKVTRQEVHWVPESRRVQLSSPERPLRVWTLYGPGRDDQSTPPTLPISPVHHNGAFMEDWIHDWQITKEGVLRYYSRAMDHSCWVLVEYTDGDGR